VREVYSICAETIVTDITSNKLSIFNVIDEIALLQFPVAVPRISVLFGVQRENEDPEQVDGLLTFSRDEVELSRWPANINFGELPRSRLIYVINGLVIPGPGQFKFALVVQGAEIARWEFPVVQPEQPEARPQQMAPQE